MYICEQESIPIYKNDALDWHIKLGHTFVLMISRKHRIDAILLNL